MPRSLFELPDISPVEYARRRAITVKARSLEMEEALHQALLERDHFISMEERLDSLDCGTPDCIKGPAKCKVERANHMYFRCLYRLACSLRKSLELASRPMVPSVDIADTGLSQSELTMLCEVLGWPAVQR